MLTEHIFKYVSGDNPKLEDEALRVAFSIIEREIDSHNVNREYIKKVRTEAGRKGGEKSGKTRSLKKS